MRLAASDKREEATRLPPVFLLVSHTTHPEPSTTDNEPSTPTPDAQ